MAVIAKTPPRDLRTIECDGCGWELEFRTKDIIHVGRSYDDDFDRTDGDYVECPREGCRKRTKIPPPQEDYDL